MPSSPTPSTPSGPNRVSSFPRAVRKASLIKRMELQAKRLASMTPGGQSDGVPPTPSQASIASYEDHADVATRFRDYRKRIQGVLNVDPNLEVTVKTSPFIPQPNLTAKLKGRDEHIEELRKVLALDKPEMFLLSEISEHKRNSDDMRLITRMAARQGAIKTLMELLTVNDSWAVVDADTISAAIDGDHIVILNFLKEKELLVPSIQLYEEIVDREALNSLMVMIKECNKNDVEVRFSEVMAMILERDAASCFGTVMETVSIPTGQSLFFFITSFGAAKCANYYFQKVENGKDAIHYFDETGYHPLHIAAKNDLPAFALILLQQGADPDLLTKTRAELTPLVMSIENKSFKVLDLLCRFGADVEQLDHRGNSPLVNAVLGGSDDTVRVLLKHGANPNSRTPEYEIPVLHLLARTPDHLPLIHSVIAYGGRMDLVDAYGNNVLHAAVMSDSHEALEVLLKYRPPLYRKNLENKLALDIISDVKGPCSRLLRDAMHITIPNKFYIEYCVDCEKHNWRTSHNAEQYQYYFDEVVKAMKISFPDSVIVGNPEPPQIGAFEVYAYLPNGKGETKKFFYHSKRHLGKWPNANYLAKRILSKAMDDGMLIGLLSDQNRDVKPNDEKKRPPPEKYKLPKNCNYQDYFKIFRPAGINKEPFSVPDGDKETLRDRFRKKMIYHRPRTDVVKSYNELDDGQEFADTASALPLSHLGHLSAEELANLERGAGLTSQSGVSEVPSSPRESINKAPFGIGEEDTVDIDVAVDDFIKNDNNETAETQGITQDVSE